jgi:hypothetical protein
MHVWFQNLQRLELIHYRSSGCGLNVRVFIPQLIIELTSRCDGLQPQIISLTSSPQRSMALILPTKVCLVSGRAFRLYRLAPLLRTTAAAVRNLLCP